MHIATELDDVHAERLQLLQPGRVGMAHIFL